MTERASPLWAVATGSRGPGRWWARALNHTLRSPLSCYLQNATSGRDSVTHDQPRVPRPKPQVQALNKFHQVNEAKEARASPLATHAPDDKSIKSWGHGGDFRKRRRHWACGQLCSLSTTVTSSSVMFLSLPSEFLYTLKLLNFILWHFKFTLKMISPVVISFSAQVEGEI